MITWVGAPDSANSFAVDGYDRQVVQGVVHPLAVVERVRAGVVTGARRRAWGEACHVAFAGSRPWIDESELELATADASPRQSSGC